MPTAATWDACTGPVSRVMCSDDYSADEIPDALVRPLDAATWMLSYQPDGDLVRVIETIPAEVAGRMSLAVL